jgi:hypothetical protein
MTIIIIGGVLFSACSTTPLPTTAENMLSLSTTLTWQEFNLEHQNSYLQKKNSAWTALITIKSKEAKRLQQITLQWTGKRICSMQASLYRKARSEQELIPIEENLVCDGNWNNQSQQITFALDEKIVAVNEYYLVLSFPKKIERKLRHGQFTLAQHNPLKLINL